MTDKTRSSGDAAAEFVDVAGQRLEIAWVGDPAASRTVVMLHEGLGSVSLWRDFPERLAQATGSRVLVYSRSGYGRSDVLAGPRAVDYMHDEALESLPELLDRLDVRRPLLFGHSDGGSIALIHAAVSEREVAGIVALAPHVKVEDISVRSIRQARVAYESTDLRQKLARHHADVHATFFGWNDIWLDPAFRAWNIEDLLPRVMCPVLAIQGVDDEYGTMEQIDSIARSVPRVQLLKLADCRHSPHRDQPDAVLAATRDFAAAALPH
jgi:pimeloyl-ACP methyl ester carboxylesterase